MTLSQSYSALSRKLYALRGRLSLWLLPASVAALLVTTPFRIADGWILLAVCALLLGSGFALRVRSTAVMLYRTRLRASGNPPAMPFPTEGIYARMRYPLYAGNFLIWFGIVLYTGTDWFVIGATALYAACYLTILGREERLMLGKYGADYRARCREVPALWPSRRSRGGVAVPVSATVSAVRREFRLLAGAVLVLLLLGIVKFRVVHLTWGIPFYWLVATGTALALFLAGLAAAPPPSGESRCGMRRSTEPGGKIARSRVAPRDESEYVACGGRDGGFSGFGRNPRKPCTMEKGLSRITRQPLFVEA